METDNIMEAKERIASITANPELASDVVASIATGIATRLVHLQNQNNVWDAFQSSLNTAIRDIQSHPRGELFRRLIQYGPLNPDDPKVMDGEGTLSDPECGQCIEFIFSHMVNRFKGELAELLAIQSATELVQLLIVQKRLPECSKLYCGDTVQEKRRLKSKDASDGLRWGNFVKGADGLIISQTTDTPRSLGSKLIVHGIIEIKSMVLSQQKIDAQIHKHLVRLNGGLRLVEDIWAPGTVDSTHAIRIAVVPSSWKLSRAWHWSEVGESRSMIYDERTLPPRPTAFEQIGEDYWKITLAWSHEALEQAAYEMTFWYMAQVGQHVYTENSIPTEWQEMTAEDAGCNAIKMMLYYIMLRYVSKRQGMRVTKLYNVYSFGYPVGVDAKEMLWTEDLQPAS
jgi:hypothetical protein